MIGRVWLYLLLLLVLAACRGVSSEGDRATTPVPSPEVTATIQEPTLTPSSNSRRTATPGVPTPSASALVRTTRPTATATPLPTPPVISETGAAELVQVASLSFPAWELVSSLAWAPRGDILAVSAGERIYLLEVPTLKELAVLDGEAFSPGLAFSPDGDLLAAGSRDGLIRIWQVASLISPNASGTSASPSPSLTIQAHNKGVNSVAFSPDGGLLASGGNDAVVRLWDVDSGQLSSQIIGGTFSVPAIAFSPEGTYLAIINGSLVRLREVSSGRMVSTLRADSQLFSLAISPDGRFLAAGDQDNTIWLWDMSAESSPGGTASAGSGGSSTPEKLAGHTGEKGSPSALIWGLAFASQGRLLASAGGDESIRLWETINGQLMGTLQGGKGAVTGVAFSPDGRTLASGGLDATLRLWQVKP